MIYILFLIKKITYKKKIKKNNNDLEKNKKILFFENTDGDVPSIFVRFSLWKEIIIFIISLFFIKVTTNTRSFSVSLSLSHLDLLLSPSL